MSAGRDDPGVQGRVPFRWACQRCARCCSGGSGYVWVEPGEIEGLAAALSMERMAFVARYVREATDPRDGERRLSLREDGAGGGGRCALLVGAAECSVYEARPAHCRRFPYWDSVLRDPAAFERARATCPGIAVVVPAELRERAFGALRELYARYDDAVERAARVDSARESSESSVSSNSSKSSEHRECCATRCPDDLYATGLEADHVAHELTTRAPRDERASSTRSSACRFGAARPLACRTARAADAESATVELRELERALGYPAAYGRLDLLLRAREAAS